MIFRLLYLKEILDKHKASLTWFFFFSYSCFLHFLVVFCIIQREYKISYILPLTHTFLNADKYCSQVFNTMVTSNTRTSRICSFLSVCIQPPYMFTSRLSLSISSVACHLSRWATCLAFCLKDITVKTCLFSFGHLINVFSDRVPILTLSLIGLNTRQTDPLNKIRSRLI